MKLLLRDILSSLRISFPYTLYHTLSTIHSLLHYTTHPMYTVLSRRDIGSTHLLSKHQIQPSHLPPIQKSPEARLYTTQHNIAIRQYEQEPH
jgi:hypothetical protein